MDLETDGTEGETALKASGLPLPRTATWESERGLHRIYRAGWPVASRRLGPRLELRGIRAYSVAPPSSGRTWVVGHIENVAPLPGEWTEFLGATQTARSGPALAVPTLAEVERCGVPKGFRNVTQARLTGRWLTQRHTMQEILAKTAAWAAQCDPPLPDAEAYQVVQSVIRTRRRGRSLEREAWLLALDHGLRGTALNVLNGLVILWQEGGGGLPMFHCSHRLLAKFAGVSRNTVGPALERLRQINFIRVYPVAIRPWEDRLADVVELCGPLAAAVTRHTTDDPELPHAATYN